jgi:O-antigen ligase
VTVLPSRAMGRDAAAVALPVTAAAALGAAFAVSAWTYSPLLLPAGLAVIALAAVSVSRPEVGVATGFVLVPLSNLGVTGQPPWAFTAVWGAFLAALGVWRWLDGATPERVPPLTMIVLANLLVAAVAFVLGGAVSNGYPELRSLATGLLYFAAAALLIRTRRELMWALAGIAVGIAIVGLYAAYERYTGAVPEQAFFTPGGSLVGRAAAGFGHANALGGFLVILIPFAIAGAVLSRRARIAFVLAAALGVYGIYASFSRGAMIGLALVPFVFLRGRRLLLVAPALAALGALLTPGLIRERFATLTESGSEVATRVDFWSTALQIWQSRPVLGAGLGQFPTAYAEARVPGRGFLPGTISEPPPHAHNIVLQALATEGLIGLLALGAVLAGALLLAVRLRRSPNRTAAVLGSAGLASVLAFLFHNMFDVTLLEGTGIYFWALLGILAGVTTGAARSERPEP